MEYMRDVRRTIEKRIFDDCELGIQSDEELIKSIETKMPLHGGCNDTIIEQQISNMDWIMENLLTNSIHNKNETTKKLVVGIIKVVNNLKYDKSTYIFKAELFNKFTKLCTAVIEFRLGPPLLISMITTLSTLMNHMNYLKCFKEVVLDAYTLSECVSTIINIITMFENIEMEKEVFIRVIDEPESFCQKMSSTIAELGQLSEYEIHNIFMTIFETVMVIIDTANRKTDFTDWISSTCELPFTALTLTFIIINNKKFLDYLTEHLFEIFSSRIYTLDPIRLLSAVYFTYRISQTLKGANKTNILPALKLLHVSLNTSINSSMLFSRVSPGAISISEMSMYEIPCPIDIMCLFSKGNVMLSTILHRLQLNLNDILG